MENTVLLHTKIRLFAEAYRRDNNKEKFIFRCVSYLRNDCDDPLLYAFARSDLETLRWMRRIDEAMTTIPWEDTDGENPYSDVDSDYEYSDSDSD
jgi:hypothetical protein